MEGYERVCSPPNAHISISRPRSPISTRPAGARFRAPRRRRAARPSRARASRGSSRADFSNEQHERARAAAAALIGADAADVALVSSVGYGVAIAGKVLAIPRGSRVLVLENDHTSPVLEWMSRADAQGFTVETVAQPANGDWTSAVLEAIGRPGAPPLALASISSIHWSDGGLLDMRTIRDALRRHGAALLVDATHSVGVIATDVKTLDPDFLIFPTYKWVLGPYGRAFVYVAKRHQDGVPLEQTSFGRRNVKAENPVYFADTRYLAGCAALRHGRARSLHLDGNGGDRHGDGGVVGRGCDHGAAVRADAADRRRPCGHERRAGARRALPRAAYAEPRISGRHAGDLIPALADQQIYVAARLGRMRVSPHVYNDEADVDRFIGAIRHATG